MAIYGGFSYRTWGFSIGMLVYQMILDGLISANDSQLAFENGHLHLIFPLNMGILDSYVSLPEGLRVLDGLPSGNHSQLALQNCHL